jgi:cell division protein FtsB
VGTPPSICSHHHSLQGVIHSVNRQHTHVKCQKTPTNSLAQRVHELKTQVEELESENEALQERAEEVEGENKELRDPVASTRCEQADIQRDVHSLQADSTVNSGTTDDTTHPRVKRHGKWFAPHYISDDESHV